ncbi:MAG: type IV pilus assembly protein PilM [Candidatus Paceibacterota bacterium]
MVSLGKTLQNLLKPKSSNVLGIDISSSSVKVVELAKKQGRASLVTYGELALGPYAGAEIGRATNLPVEKIVEALKDILRESKVSTKNCGVAIPMSSSLIRLIEMPDLGDEKLKKMIPLEIRKYIPVPITEVLLDWWIIPDEVSDSEDGKNKAPGSGSATLAKKVDVLVVAIHNDIIARYRDIIKRTELESSFFEIEIFSTLRAVLDRGTKPVMIVDIGAATTKVYVVEKGIIRSSHIVNSGSQDITLTLSTSRDISVAQAEEEKREKGMGAHVQTGSAQGPSVVLENILFEAKRVKISFERKSGKKVDSALFTGGGSMVQGLNEKATELLELPTSLAHPFSRVEAPPFLEDLLKKIGPEFSVAIGVALRKLDEGK